MGFSADTDACERPMKGILFDHAVSAENKVFASGIRERFLASDYADGAARGLREI